MSTQGRAHDGAVMTGLQIFPSEFGSVVCKAPLVSSSQRPAREGDSAHLVPEPRRKMQGRSHAALGAILVVAAGTKGKLQRRQLDQWEFPYLESAYIFV